MQQRQNAELVQALTQERAVQQQQFASIVELVAARRDAGHGSTRKVDPPAAFDGDRSLYESFRLQLNIWEVANKDISPARRGPLLLQALRGDAQSYVLSRMELSDIGDAGGYDGMVQLLDERFRRPDDSRAFEAFDSAIACVRGPGQSLDAFLHDFDAKWSAAEKCGVWASPDSMKAHMLIKQANLLKGQRSQLFLQLDAERARCGEDAKEAQPLAFDRVSMMVRAIADAHAGTSEQRTVPVAVAADGVGDDVSQESEVQKARLVLLAAEQRGYQQRQYQPSSKLSQNRKYCTFCRAGGHVESQCFTKDRALAVAAAKDASSPLHEKAKRFLANHPDPTKPVQGGASGAGH